MNEPWRGKKNERDNPEKDRVLSPDESVVVRYEQLHDRMVSNLINPDNSGETTLIIKRGMYVWIKSLPCTKGKKMALEPSSDEKALDLNLDNGSLVSLLVNMVLNNHKRGLHHD